MKNFSCIKISASFFISLAVGVGASQFFMKSASDIEVFTREEAVSHLGKTVKDRCAKNFGKTSGRTMYVDEGDINGGYFVVIDWDYSFRGNHEIFSTSKSYYKKCVIEAGSFER